MTLAHRFAFAASALAFAVAIAPTAGAAESADDCVAISRTEQTSGLTFEVKNNCDRKLSCSMGWRLSCENASGKTTSSSRESASFGMSASAEHKVNGSAASCKDGWKIDDVTWTCAAQK